MTEMLFKQRTMNELSFVVIMMACVSASSIFFILFNFLFFCNFLRPTFQYFIPYILKETNVWNENSSWVDFAPVAPFRHCMTSPLKALMQTFPGDPHVLSEDEIEHVLI